MALICLLPKWYDYPTCLTREATALLHIVDGEQISTQEITRVAEKRGGPTEAGAHLFGHEGFLRSRGPVVLSKVLELLRLAARLAENSSRWDIIESQRRPLQSLPPRHTYTSSSVHSYTERTISCKIWVFSISNLQINQGCLLALYRFRVSVFLTRQFSSFRTSLRSRAHALLLRHALGLGTRDETGRNDLESVLTSPILLGSD